MKALAHQETSFLRFDQFDNSYAGWPKAWSFFVGVLQSAYTLTGYGMVAALCEEVKNPAREVPRAMGELGSLTDIQWISLILSVLFQCYPSLRPLSRGSSTW